MDIQLEWTILNSAKIEIQLEWVLTHSPNQKEYSALAKSLG